MKKSKRFLQRAQDYEKIKKIFKNKAQDYEKIKKILTKGLIL